MGGRCRMPVKRMDRDQFFVRLAPLDDEHLRKILWNLYWRGSVPIRERIETELDPRERQRRRSMEDAVDPEWVLRDVTDFVTLRGPGLTWGAIVGSDRASALAGGPPFSNFARMRRGPSWRPTSRTGLPRWSR